MIKYILFIILFFFHILLSAQNDKLYTCKCDNISKVKLDKCIGPSFSKYFSSLYGINTYFDFDEGLQCAMLSKKPCLIYFNGHNSIKSRKVESEILADSEINKIINNNYVFIMLSKDDKKELSPFYQVISSKTNDTIVTYGVKSTYYQDRLFGEDVHPAFYSIDLDKNKLSKPFYYGSTKEDFKSFLQNGINNFNLIEDNSSNETKFELRVHQSFDKTDFYRLKGGIICSEFVDLFKSIDWEYDYLKESETENYNYTDIEVLNENNFFYLSISVGPQNDATFQYIIGFGYHQNRIDQVSRIIKLYGTKTTDQDIIVGFIESFFCNDIRSLSNQLEQFEFLIELDDLYQNYE